MKFLRVILILSITSFTIKSYPQSDKDKNTLSFIDKVQQIIELKKSFINETETKKPALFSFKKDDGDKSVFTIDIALSLKIFRFETYGISPFIQFDYSTKSKDETEKILGGVSAYYLLYEYSGGSGKIEPLISYSKDFINETEELNVRISYMPRFPKFFIPVRNINEIKFKYDGSKEDDRWVFGLNPFLGMIYDRQLETSANQYQSYYFSSVGGNLTLKRYYLQFDLYGIYENEFDNFRNSRYKYEGTATFYFDEKERSSFNAKYTQEIKDDKFKKTITLGFGIKL